MLLLALLLSTQVDTPVAQSVSLSRGPAGTCVGSVAYSLPLQDAALRTTLGDPSRVLPIVVPCARIDAIDALLALPDNLSGKLSVRTEEARIDRAPDGLCAATLQRTLTPTNADVLEARGVGVVQQRLPTVACTRIAQALVGAQVPRGGAAGWPVRLVALPVPEAP